MQESIAFLLRVQCRRKESSRSLSHLLMSFLYLTVVTKDGLGEYFFLGFLARYVQNIQYNKDTVAFHTIRTTAHCIMIIIIQVYF